MGRRVRFFASQIDKEKDTVPVRSLYETPPLITTGPRAAQAIDELDLTLAEHEKRLTRMNESYQTLSERTRELVEARHVLRETAVFFDRVRGFASRISTQFLTPCIYRLKDSSRISVPHLTIVSLLCFKMIVKLHTLAKRVISSLTLSESSRYLFMERC